MTLKVYIIAGEPSGDLLASGMMRAIRVQCPEVEFRGVGGESMRDEGMESRFDIAEISVMGVVEVLGSLSLITKRIRQTVNDIVDWQPDVLVTVDSWGFVSSVVGKLRKHKVAVRVVHYVAPQVWAWKKGRAKSVARLVDRLMMLLPYEGKYFEKFSLKCDFVGHPVMERMSGIDFDLAEFRNHHQIPEDALVLSLLPGSRHSEVVRMIPVFKQAVEIIKRELGDLFVIVPTVAGVEAEVRKCFAGWDIPVRVVVGSAERYNAFKTSHMALATSGTVSLELTAIGVPHLIAYTFNPVTNWLVKRVIKIRYANLINILEDCEIIPELVLDHCRPRLIAETAQELLTDTHRGQEQTAEARRVLERLRLPEMLPSERAAQIVIEEAKRMEHCV
jgi:lipid-A-disaccharide synthase